MLYIVSTPIGNLKDITYRAVEVLQTVNVIYAEDTRRTMVLLNAYNIKKPLVSYHKYNEKQTVGEIVERLVNGSINEECPATILRKHKKAHLYLDKDSAENI